MKVVTKSGIVLYIPVVGDVNKSYSTGVLHRESYTLESGDVLTFCRKIKKTPATFSPG